MEKIAANHWNILRASLSGVRALSVFHPSAHFFTPVVTHRHFNRRLRKWTKRHELVTPGYVFVKGIHPMALQRTPIHGVRGFLRDASGEVVTVDYDRTLLPFYRGLLDRQNVETVEDFSPLELTEGMKVKWKDGTALQGNEGIVVKAHNDGTVTLEICRDERAISVTSQPDLLEAV